MGDVSAEIKGQIIVASVDALINHGLPAMVRMVSALNDKSKVTLEDIQALRGELDSAKYFEDN